MPERGDSEDLLVIGRFFVNKTDCPKKLPSISVPLWVRERTGRCRARCVIRQFCQNLIGCFALTLEKNVKVILPRAGARIETKSGSKRATPRHRRLIQLLVGESQGLKPTRNLASSRCRRFKG
jgi:hypothetical protein